MFLQSITIKIIPFHYFERVFDSKWIIRKRIYKYLNQSWDIIKKNSLPWCICSSWCFYPKFLNKPKSLFLWRILWKPLGELRPTTKLCSSITRKDRAVICKITQKFPVLSGSYLGGYDIWSRDEIWCFHHTLKCFWRAWFIHGIQVVFLNE